MKNPPLVAHTSQGRGIPKYYRNMARCAPGGPQTVHEPIENRRRRAWALW